MRDRVAIRRHDGPERPLPPDLVDPSPEHSATLHVGLRELHRGRLGAPLGGLPSARRERRGRALRGTGASSRSPLGERLAHGAKATLVMLLTGLAACDAENLQDRLQQAIMRQSGRGDRQAAREAAKASHGRTGLPKPIVAALNLIAESDAVFIVKKDKKKDRTYSGFNFAAMLTTKTIWLGRGIEGLDLWIEEIASGSFMNRESYQVRRPDGVNEELTSWLVRQIASQPETAEERRARREAEAIAAEEEAAANGGRRSSRSGKNKERAKR